MSRLDQQVNLRIPADIKTWIETQATKNGSSQNSEVIRALRERKERVESGNANG